MKSNIEYVCISCWHTFKVPEINPTSISCPECGSIQDLSQDHFELNVDEYVSFVNDISDPSLNLSAISPEQEIVVTPEADDTVPPPVEEAPESRPAVELSNKTSGDSLTPPLIEVSDADDDDDDELEDVIEIDLSELDDELDIDDVDDEDELDYEDTVIEDISELELATQEEQAEKDASDQAEEDSWAIWYLRTEAAFIYEFVNYAHLIGWAVAMDQDLDNMHVSLDGQTWKSLAPFYQRFKDSLAVDDFVKADVPIVDEEDKPKAIVSDDDIMMELQREQSRYKSKGPKKGEEVVPASEDQENQEETEDGAEDEAISGLAAKVRRAEGRSEEVKAVKVGAVEEPGKTKKPVRRGPVRETSQFDFKLEHTKIGGNGWKYFVIFLIGLLFGGGVLYALYYFKILQQLFP